MSLAELVSWRRIVAILLSVVYLTSGLLINFVQLCLFVFLKPISEIHFRKFNYYLSYSLYAQIVFLLLYWNNASVKFNGKKGEFEKYFGKEPGFVIMNHGYEVDWMIGWILCDGCGILGCVRTFAKKSLKYLPTLGYSWWMGGSIFVQRDWRKDQIVFDRKLKELIAYDEPMWLLLTAEGTRFTKEKHAASVAFAREHGLPELRHHLTPRTKGFSTAIPIVRKKLHAVYDVNIGVRPNGGEPTLTKLLLGKPIVAEVYVDRYPMEELPESEEDLAKWLHALYKKKDDLLHRYLTTGRWQEASDTGEYDSFYLPRKIFPAINFALWAVVVVIPWGFCLYRLLTSGSWFHFVLVVVVVGSFVLLLKKLMGETKISKGSSYGTRKT